MSGYISFSRLNLYCRCGYQYYLRYILKVIVPRTTPLIMGTGYHSSLQQNHLQKIDSAVDMPLPELGDFYASQIEEAFKEDVLLTKEQKGQNKVIVRDDTIKRGQSALKVYHDEFAPTLMPLEVERAFTVPLADDVPPLYGIIDLVTADMRVVDHKTASKSPSKGTADSSLQLSAYALGFQSLYGFLPESLELQHSVVTEKGNSKADVQKTVRTPEQLERFVNRVRLVWDGIQKGVFIPPEQGSWACGYCGYRDTGICRL